MKIKIARGHGAFLLLGPACLLLIPALFVPALQAGTITVLSPNGGETICPSHNQLTVSWSASGLPAGTLINVDLYKNGVKTNYIFKNIPLSPSSRPWTELNSSGASGDGYKVRISTTDGTVFDESDAPFTLAHVPMTVRMVTPHGGERWRLGEVHRIEWSCSGCCWSVPQAGIGIFLLTPPYDPYHNTVAGVAIGAPFYKGYFVWTVGDNQGGKIIPPGSDYKMEVYSIVWCPTAGDAINPNRTWLSPAAFSIYPEGADLPPQAIVSDPAHAVVPPTEPKPVKSPIVVHREPAPHAIIAVEFLKLLTPVGGEHWTLGQPQKITWSWMGPADRLVNIFLMKDFRIVGALAKGLPAGKGTFDWTAGEAGKTLAEPSDDYRIEIVAPASGSRQALRSKSPKAFSLVKAPKILQLPERKK